MSLSNGLGFDFKFFLLKKSSTLKLRFDLRSTNYRNQKAEVNRSTCDQDYSEVGCSSFSSAVCRAGHLDADPVNSKEALSS